MTHHWQRRQEQPSHVDDWLMTYADTITLLLCFFAIFLIVSASKKNIPQKAPVQQIVEKTEQLPPPVQPLQIEQPPVLPPVMPPPQLPDVFRGDLPFHDIDDADEPLPPVIAPPPVVGGVAPVKADDPVSLSQIADNLKAQGPANFEQKGDRITTLEVSSAAFFDSGSAVLSNSGKSILRDVAANLKSDKFKDYRITVEGHTDDSPIHTAQFPSNWELSTARAAAVVHFFLDQGISAEKLRAAGYADTFPKAPNRDANGNPISANRAQNRRVVIKLEKIVKNDN